MRPITRVDEALSAGACALCIVCVYAIDGLLNIPTNPYLTFIVEVGWAFGIKLVFLHFEDKRKRKHKREIVIDKMVTFQGLDPYIKAYNAEREIMMDRFRNQEADAMQRYMEDIERISREEHGSH